MTRRKRIWQIIAVIAALLVTVLLCDWLYLRFHAKSRYSDLCTSAMTIGYAARDWLAEGHPAAELTEDGDFADFLDSSGSPYLDEHSHYAVLCDEAGTIGCVLYSRRPIADKYLKDPPQGGDGADQDKMLRLLQTPLFWRNAVGVYYP